MLGKDSTPKKRKKKKQLIPARYKIIKKNVDKVFVSGTHTIPKLNDKKKKHK